MTMSNHDLAQEPNWITGRLRNSEFFATPIALLGRFGSDYRGRCLYQHFAPASCRLLGVFSCSDGSYVRCHAMGKCSGQACAISLGIDPSAPLDRYFVYDEHGATARASHDVACSSYQPCTFDVLALGAFLAGVSFLSPQICFLGFALALAVPAIAWLNRSALFLTLAAVLLIGLGIIFWPSRVGHQAAKSGET
jgi:hypothetical protein